ncbi:hypothetical protein H9Q74_001258 [Fusarium xylarioides]|nr:hypothetical protein H9Q71_000765 [Fusarium xylarioides]KAG5828651.1 hypothetical protein H9Q74_001258 [Fusarium xylarioides]
MTYARKHPGDVLSYLRRVWPEQGERVVENPACLRLVNGLKVLLENGETCQIHKTWIPLPELRRLRGRYLLPVEKASFPRLDPPLPEDGTLGDWEFLPQLGCQTAPNLYFWVSTLSDIKFNSKYKVTSPQRVKELYLLLYEIYEEAVDGNGGEKKVANYIRYHFTRGSLLLQPKGWGNPDLSFRYGPKGMYLKKCSMPLPAEWNATPSESNLVARFYEEVLLLEDVTRYTVILEELKLYLTKYRSTGNRFKDISNLYQGLEDLDNLDELIDPSEFISKPIFPILTPTGESKRVCGDTAFFIVDDMRLFNLFRDKTNMLAFTRSQVMRLEPLFKWLGMQKKYLTVQAKYTVKWPFGSKLRHIEWDIGQKAEALLRIAAYFRSCQTEGDFSRKELLQALRQAVMMEVEDMWSETKLIGIETRDNQHSLDDPGNVVQDSYPQLKLGASFRRDDSRLIAHVPADKKQQQLAIAVALPRLLMEWLMTSPTYHDRGRGGRVDIPELGDRCAPDNEVCLDQVEVQEAKEPLQATRTSATASPAQTPPVEIPSEQAPVTQAPETDQNGVLYELVDKASVTETGSRRKILIPHTRKPRPSAGLSTSSESPPGTVESTAREVH